jgi:hypothetical protein
MLNIDWIVATRNTKRTFYESIKNNPSRLNLKNSNWQKYIDIIHKEIETEFMLDNNDCPDKLTILITNAVEKMISKCHNNKKSKVPW